MLNIVPYEEATLNKSGKWDDETVHLKPNKN